MTILQNTISYIKLKLLGHFNKIYDIITEIVYLFEVDTCTILTIDNYDNAQVIQTYENNRFLKISSENSSIIYLTIRSSESTNPRLEKKIKETGSIENRNKTYRPTRRYYTENTTVVIQNDT